jgi:starch-binding outer membrane protein, SusD/RagB family
MKRYIRSAALAAIIPLLAAVGCGDDYLKCADCITSPNAPTSATSSQRLVAVQAKLTQFLNGNMARVVSMWMQQMAGTDGQYVSQDLYVLDGGSGDFSMPYTGGGLIDLRAIEANSTATGDKTFLGIAQILKAWEIGTLADFWGDVPYTQAAKPDSFPTPAYDPQQAVYDSVLASLDAGIANLSSGTGVGPGSAEIVYRGDRTLWTQLAHTLKARIYLHIAERDPSSYARALTEANQGISGNAADYLTVQTSNANEQNDWYQFLLTGTRTGFQRAGEYEVNLLKGLGDPRLAEYYQKAAGAADYIGAKPGQGLTGSMASISARRLAPDYRQPLVTYNENLLIKAEALFQMGNAQAALDTLNRERAAWATATPWHSAITLTPVGGPVSLAGIMREKYITLFQNVETWNDYKRTCLPNLVPANGSVALPGRMLYTNSERQTNPSVPADPIRNWNDPQSCGGA